MKNILEYLERSTASFPEKTAFSDETSALTYGEFTLRAKSIGSYLLQKSVERAPVAVLLDKTAESLAALMGVVYAGDFYAVMDAQMPAARMQLIFRDLSPAAVLTDRSHEALARKAGFAGPVLLMEDALCAPQGAEALQRVRDSSIDTDPVYVLFTSGSTGTPKGTVVCHRSVIAYTEWVGATFALDEGTVFGNQTPFFFSMSVLDLFSTLRNAATLHILPKKLFAFPGKLIEYLTERKVNTIYWVPSALSILSNWKIFDFMPAPSLKTVLFSGEVMPAKVLNYWSAHLPGTLFANLYGPTEVTDICTYYIVNRTFSNEETIPIGNACDNCGVLVVKPDGREAGADEEGELYVRGSFLALGYYNNPKKTSEVFVQNPLNPHYPELVYKTGDLVRRNSRGELLYVTRRDFQIKHMGYRIELGEIEAAAGAVEGVESCAGLYDAPEDQIILFYQGASVDNPSLLKSLRGRLPRYMLPAKLFRLEQMPHNANGKIDRTRLKADYENKNREATPNA
ncbi:MAG: amino acid adenylation domain-containing protein [Clostridia bacterium]|nr:amino acid adenylation domain-containing protein [Clostridia bacterium]